MTHIIDYQNTDWFERLKASGFDTYLTNVDAKLKYIYPIVCTPIDIERGVVRQYIKLPEHLILEFKLTFRVAPYDSKYLLLIEVLAKGTSPWSWRAYDHGEVPTHMLGGLICFTNSTGTLVLLSKKSIQKEIDRIVNICESISIHDILICLQKSNNQEIRNIMKNIHEFVFNKDNTYDIDWVI